MRVATIPSIVAAAAIAISACSTAGAGAQKNSAPAESYALKKPAAPARAPQHLLTADYFGGQAGTHVIPADRMASVTDWVETSPHDTTTWRSGMHVMFYTDPNRQIENEPLWTQDEAAFAHDCSGSRVSRMYPSRGGNGRQQFLMDPNSPAMRGVWRSYVQRYFNAGRFSAVFDDDAANLAYMDTSPCNAGSWVQASVDAIRSLGYPVVYNGLEPAFGNDRISPAIALNKVSIGGMMEDCYAERPRPPSGARWLTEEATELAMKRDGKLFFCYGNGIADAAASTDLRMYELASFLLTYDPQRSILWEHWATPSAVHVMPESAFVPIQPVRHVLDADDMRAGGVYQREYYRCYLQGRLLGGCDVVVNPSNSSASVPSTRYHHALTISGSGIFDGGSVGIGPAPQTLDATSAAILVP
jgi:hypothetical protein